MRIGIPDLPVHLSRIGEGDGEPVLVLPGGACRGPEYLGDLAGVGTERPLVVVHPRGTPLSGGLSRGWWTDADDVVSVLDGLGLTSADILAHSAGTRLALATATRFPDRVRSMALVTPPASWLTGTAHDRAELAVDRSDPAVAEAIRSMAEDDAPDSEEEFRVAFLRQAPASYARWTALEQAHARVGAVSLASASAWFQGIPEDAVSRILATRMPPTVVIGGDRDLVTGVRPVLDYAAALGADAELIEECGHYPWVEQPDAFRAVLGAWLAGRTVAA